jgi:hypothetical protein
MNRVPLIAAGIAALVVGGAYLGGAFDPAVPSVPVPAAVPTPAAPAALTPEVVAPAPTPDPSALALLTSQRPRARTGTSAPAAEPVIVTLPGSVQRLDRQRYFDLRELAWGLRCTQPGAVLPATLYDPAYCGGRNVILDPRDPVTGQGYRYSRIDDARFSLCADLDDLTVFAVRGARESGFDPATGCLTGRIR